MQCNKLVKQDFMKHSHTSHYGHVEYVHKESLCWKLYFEKTDSILNLADLL